MENPENGELVARLSKEFSAHRAYRESAVFWTSFGFYFLESGAAMKLLLGWGDDELNDITFDMLSERFSNRFPTSEISKAHFPYLKFRGLDGAADDFLVDQIQLFVLDSSLTRFVEDKVEEFGSDWLWKFGVVLLSVSWTG
jgi:hypothetical protein